MATFTQTIASAQDGMRHPAVGWFDNITAAVGNIASGAEGYYGRITSVTIPQGSTVSAATIQVTPVNTLSATTWSAKFGCEAADNPAIPASNAQFDGRVLTTSFSTETNTTWTANTARNIPDFAGACQEVFARGGWASGNALGCIFRDNGSSTGGTFNRDFYQGNIGTASFRPVFSCTYNPPAKGMPFRRRATRFFRQRF